MMRAMSGPCLDIYAWVRNRDRSVIRSFVDRYVDLDRGTGMMQDEIELAPLNLPPVVPRQFWDQRDGWESVHVDSIDDAIRLGLGLPPRVFGLYLCGKAPYICAMLNFTLDGGVILGASIEDDSAASSHREAEHVAVSMVDQFHAQRAWVVGEEPAPDDPLAEHPWTHAIFAVASDC